MNIALCDDEKIFREDLQHLLYKFSFEYDIDLHVESFSSGEELVKSIKCLDKKYDLIFLDILMTGINGIETAKEIRRVNNDVKIVFLTSTAEFALSGYDVKALNYLIKPMSYEKTKKICLELHETLYETDSNFTYTINHTLYSIPLKEINYFEVRGRIIYINTVDNVSSEEKAFYKKIEDLKEELQDKYFVKSHRSYLINIKNIASISSKEIVFINNETAPISRRLYQEIKDRFLEYSASII